MLWTSSTDDVRTKSSWDLRRLSGRTFQELCRSYHDSNHDSIATIQNGDSSIERSDLDLYQYSELGAGEIRLLRLLPGNVHSQVNIQILHSDITTNPQYSAISYVWGKRKTDSHICINGKEFSVRENLARLLKDIRHPKEPSIWWIDAICIDQNDHIERNAQVQRMGEIYAKASHVTAWLDGIRRQDAADIVRDLFADAKENPTEHIRGRRAWGLLQLMEDNPYWWRRWIVQEILLAREVYLRFGGHQIAMRELVALDISSGFAAPTGLRRLLTVPGVHTSYHREAAKMSKLLFEYEDAACTDVRDTVFALRALSKTALEYLPVDYTWTPAELFFNVVDYACVHEARLTARDIWQLCTLLLNQLKVNTSQVLKRIRLSYSGESPPLTAYSKYANNATSSRMHPSCIYLRNVGRCVRSPEYVRLNGRAPRIVEYSPLPQFRLRRVEDGGVIFERGSSSPYCVGEAELSLWGWPSTCICCLPNKISEEPLVNGFVWERCGSASMPKNSCLGLASRQIEVGDEIWQMACGPVAIIRRTINGVPTFVARAYLYSDSHSVIPPFDVDELAQPENDSNFQRAYVSPEVLLEVWIWSKHDDGVKVPESLHEGGLAYDLSDTECS